MVRCQHAPCILHQGAIDHMDHGILDLGTTQSADKVGTLPYPQSKLERLDSSPIGKHGTSPLSFSSPLYPTGSPTTISSSLFCLFISVPPILVALQSNTTGSPPFVSPPPPPPSSFPLFTVLQPQSCSSIDLTNQTDNHRLYVETHHHHHHSFIADPSARVSISMSIPIPSVIGVRQPS